MQKKRKLKKFCSAGVFLYVHSTCTQHGVTTGDQTLLWSLMFCICLCICLRHCLLVAWVNSSLDSLSSCTRLGATRDQILFWSHNSSNWEIICSGQKKHTTLPMAAEIFLRFSVEQQKSFFFFLRLSCTLLWCCICLCLCLCLCLCDCHCLLVSLLSSRSPVSPPALLKPHATRRSIPSQVMTSSSEPGSMYVVQ